MQPDLVVYTTVLGRTDPLREPRHAGKARWVCFSDRQLASKVWEVVLVPETATPVRECRRRKQLSHVEFPEAAATLWLDAAFQLLVPPEQVLAMATADVMGFRHPDRRRITDEAPAIIRAGKGKSEAIWSQLAAYQAEGWDTDFDPQRHITNGGFLLRRHTDAVKRFNDAWHHEVQTRSLRDQMSIDYCAWRAGVAIGHFAGTVRRNNLARMQVMRGKGTTDF